jgi:hypothetical protein
MRIAVLALAGCLCVAFYPERAVARIYFYESIELITAESDMLVRGTIAEIGGLKPDWEYDAYRFKLVIKVAETLRGPQSDELTVALVSLDPMLEKHRERGTELLFSLRRWGGARDVCSSTLHAWIELGGGGAGVVTMDFRVLTARADILKAARDGVAAAPAGGEKKRHRLEPPLSSEFSTIHPMLGRNCVGYVWVPADQRLQQCGERWATANSTDFRALAPIALLPFKSDKNIAILKRLLSDDSHLDLTNARGYGRRCYLAREPAYRVLKEWGIKVEKPAVTEVPLRGIEDLVSGNKADFPAIDRAGDEGGTNSSSAFFSRPFTAISTIPTAPPSPAGR